MINGQQEAVKVNVTMIFRQLYTHIHKVKRYIRKGIPPELRGQVSLI